MLGSSSATRTTGVASLVILVTIRWVRILRRRVVRDGDFSTARGRRTTVTVIGDLAGKNWPGGRIHAHFSRRRVAAGPEDDGPGQSWLGIGKTAPCPAIGS